MSLSHQKVDRDNMLSLVMYSFDPISKLNAGEWIMSCSELERMMEAVVPNFECDISSMGDK